ncbi:MAG: MBL fold metallo-hydrolase, partial [Actinobacteria bacterium]|nr:MBL fold metallo-hydrolase [Actinomycetota bacterium]
IEGDDGWTLVDTGYDYPPNYEIWERGAVAVGCDLGNEVTRIVVTHFHPDHLGGARWLQERSGAPVYMLGDEIPFSRWIWGSLESREPFIEYLIRHGVPREMAGPATVEIRSGLPLPEEMLPLRAGERFSFGRNSALVIHTPGHADNQFVLHDEARGILFAADHLLLEITPNVGLWPESEPHPLARYLGSLNELRGLEADLVLPGHGPVFHDLDGRIAELLRHHEERLDLMRGVIEDGPKTSYAVSRIVFRGAVTVRQRCFALAETLAHLDHLVLVGRAERVEGEPVAYLA